MDSKSDSRLAPVVTSRGHEITYSSSAVKIKTPEESLTIQWRRFVDRPASSLRLVSVLVDPLLNTYLVSQEKKGGRVYALSPGYQPFSSFPLPFAPLSASLWGCFLSIEQEGSRSPALFTAKGLRPGERGKHTAPPSKFFLCSELETEHYLQQEIVLDREKLSRSGKRGKRGKDVYSKEELLAIGQSRGVGVKNSWSKQEIVEAISNSG